MNNIKKFRKKTGYSQVSFSKLMNWNKQRLCNYENGKRLPDVYQAALLIEKLNSLGVKCDLRDLYPMQKH